MSNENSDSVLLYSYWRSSSAYRVRIALNLKRIEYRQKSIHLVRGGGEQNAPGYRAINPLGLVPALVHRDRTIVQSMAICEYLEEVFPAHPLLPEDPAGRARIRGIAQSIASEIQPLNNLGVTNYLRDGLHQDESAISDWYAHWIARGFSAVESWLSVPGSGLYCHGDVPTLADCFLVPQVYNAERVSCDLEPFPIIRRIAGQCRSLPAFEQAAPELQADAVN
ncbi:MAG: maleylacetoacetate isomerase [Xanthomonadales bacterium]|nr:maleylacetoacetate isomerase [Xanthomonadales bacterium]